MRQVAASLVPDVFLCEHFFRGGCNRTSEILEYDDVRMLTKCTRKDKMLVWVLNIYILWKLDQKGVSSQELGW